MLDRAATGSRPFTTPSVGLRVTLRSSCMLSRIQMVSGRRYPTQAASGYRDELEAPGASATTPSRSSADVVRTQGVSRRKTVCVRAAQVSTNDFKNGLTVEIEGAPYKVIGAALTPSAPPRPRPMPAPSALVPRHAQWLPLLSRSHGAAAPPARLLHGCCHPLPADDGSCRAHARACTRHTHTRTSARSHAPTAALTLAFSPLLRQSSCT